MKKFILTTVAGLTLFFAHAQCQADFSYMQNGPTTIFTDLSTINSGWSTNYSVTWEWDFGDGTISTQQNPIHTYANNAIYTPCLTVVYLDSTIFNWCTSIYCDSLLIGSGSPVSWDCNPNSFGCFDPGTGNGQFSTLASCQSACSVTPSWDCGLSGCYDPGTGLGQYTNISSCQSFCSTSSGVLCDSIVVSGSQTQLTMQVNNFNSIIYYWLSTAPDGTVLGEDSMWNMHNVYNSFTIPNDTITTCITYQDFMGWITCCVTWVWDANSGIWAKQGSFTSVGEIDSFDKKLLKVVDFLGREISVNSNKTLFFLYEDGTIEKRITLD
jgi:hypothetical protein